MGPKKFETWKLCLGLFVKQVYQLSYRRAARFLEDFFNIQLHWTTIQKAAARLPRSLWQSLLAVTICVEHISLAAADGTGFSRSGPSHYFLKRIDREGPVGSVAPTRKRCRRGKHRKLMRDCMDWYIYWQRNIIESLYSALKKLFGNTVRCKNIRTQTTELFCRLIAYNLGLKTTEIFY